MKKIVFVAKIVLLLALTGSSSWGTPKVPAKLCLTNNDGSMVLVIVTRPAGPSINFQNKKIRLVDVSGYLLQSGKKSVPFKGTGHVNGSVFDFTATGSSYTGTGWPHMETADFEVSWDIFAKSGQWKLVYVYRGSDGVYAGYGANCCSGIDLGEISCSMIDFQ